jgi:hypothetical protein
MHKKEIVVFLNLNVMKRLLVIRLNTVYEKYATFFFFFIK